MKRLLLSIFCFWATSTSHAQDAALPKALIPDPRPDAGLIKRHESFNEISKKGEAQLIFLGDSITQ